MKVGLYNNNELLEVSGKLIDASNILRKYIQRHHSNNTGSFFIKIKDGSIFINDVKIVSKKARIQYIVLKALVNKYTDDFWKDEISFISTSEIAAILEKNGFYARDCARQVRQAISKIRMSIQQNFKNQFSNDAVIISKKWKGYRLNEYVVLGRK